MTPTINNLSSILEKHDRINKKKQTLVEVIIQDIFSYFESIFFVWKTKRILRQDNKQLTRLIVLFSSIVEATEDEVYFLIRICREFEQSAKNTKLFLEDDKITHYKVIAKLLKENLRLTQECVNILSLKLYPSKPQGISDIEWEEHNKKMEAWAGDEWEDEYWDEWDVQFAPILKK